MTRLVRLRGSAVVLDDVIDGEESGSGYVGESGGGAPAVSVTPIASIASVAADATTSPVTADSKAA